MVSFRLILLALIAGTILVGCTEPADQRVVNVYTARHYASDEAIYAEFTRETGIHVNTVSASGDLLIERVRADGDRSPADIIITVDSARLYRAQDAGLFAASDFDAITQSVPARYVEPNGHWVATSARARGIAFSRDRVAADELSSYEDLADPKWAGRLCMRSSDNVYNQSLLASLVAHLGPEAAEDWARGVVANFARPPSGGDTDQLRAIAAGECDASLVNHYYFARLANSEAEADQNIVDAVDMYFPGAEFGGVHVNVSGVGIAAAAPHPEEAMALIEFLLSNYAQRAFAEMTNEFPVTGLDDYDNDNVRRFINLPQDDLDFITLGEQTATAQRIFDRAGWP